MEGMPYLRRSAAERLRFLLKTFPAVLVYGPRQCGKSTLVREELSTWTYLDLEEPAAHDRLRADMQGFFEANTRHVVFDEAQRLPELFTALRHFLDREKAKGRYVLTGSANPSIVPVPGRRR